MSDLSKITDLAGTIWQVFLTKENAQLGNYSTLDLAGLIRAKRVAPTDLVWAAPLEDWIEVSTLTQEILRRSAAQRGSRSPLEASAQIKASPHTPATSSANSTSVLVVNEVSETPESDTHSKSTYSIPTKHASEPTVDVLISQRGPDLPPEQANTNTRPTSTSNHSSAPPVNSNSAPRKVLTQTASPSDTALLDESAEIKLPTPAEKASDSEVVEVEGALTPDIRNESDLEDEALMPDEDDGQEESPKASEKTDPLISWHQGNVAHYDFNDGYGIVTFRLPARREFFRARFNTRDIENEAKLVKSEPVKFALRKLPENPRKLCSATQIQRVHSRLKGTVSEWQQQERVGRIREESTGKEYFIHYSNICAEGPRFLDVGEKVEFAIVIDARGRKSADYLTPEESRFLIERVANLDRIYRTDMLEKLKIMAMDESWDYRAKNYSKSSEKDTVATKDGTEKQRNRNDSSERDLTRKYPVLYNYLYYTLSRLVFENKLVEVNDGGTKIAFANTGLATEFQQEIYACFHALDNPIGQKRWFLHSFMTENDRKTLGARPELANYFENPGELLFDSSLPFTLETKHIIRDNKKRFPPNLRDNETVMNNLLEGAKRAALQRIKRNYKTAIPQFHLGRVQLLLPLCLTDPSRADLALVINKDEHGYFGSTALSLRDAYNNARLIARPDREWLEPERSEDTETS